MAKQLKEELKADRKAEKVRKKEEKQSLETQREKFAKKAKRKEHIKDHGLYNGIGLGTLVGLSVINPAFFSVGIPFFLISNIAKVGIVDDIRNDKKSGPFYKGKQAYNKAYKEFDRLEKEAEKSLGSDTKNNEKKNEIDLGEGDY